MKEPIISVIMPVYNVEQYLPQCLDSILAQTYGNFELICVDDGSTDGSGNVLEKYAVEDARIKVIHQKNGGVSAARNSGLKIACGDYIYFMDSDDVIRPEWFERAAAIIAENEPDCLMCNYVEMTDYIPFEDVLPYIKAQKIKNPFEVFILRKSLIDASVCNKMYKATLLGKQVFTQDIVYAEDLWFNLEFLAKAQTFYYLPQPMYGYIRHENSITTSNFNDRKACGFLSICANAQKHFGQMPYFTTIRNNISNLNLKFMLKNMHKLPDGGQKYERKIAKLLHSGAVGYKNLPLKHKWKLWKIGRKHNDA